MCVYCFFAVHSLNPVTKSLNQGTPCLKASEIFVQTLGFMVTFELVCIMYAQGTVQEEAH